MEDCYLFIDMDQDVPDEEKHISILCVECRNEHYPNIGWFWKGTEQGYGPWEYICTVCKKRVDSTD